MPEQDRPATPPVHDGLTILERTSPDPSEANDKFVVWTALGGAGFALAFAFGVRFGAPIGAYAMFLGLSCVLLGLAVRRYFFDRFPEVVAAQLRETPDPPEDSIPAVEGPLPRRGFLTRVLVAAFGVFGVSLLALVPSLGPRVGDTLRQTPWARGVRAVTSDGLSLRPEDVVVGSITTVWPQGSIGFERAAVVVMRLSTQPLPPTEMSWVVDDTLVAYSKICTHAGCPVALYRERDESLFCPCHQSTFDVPHACRPVFGPAARALPQLPLGVDDAGFLVALGDFEDPVGPTPA